MQGISCANSSDCWAVGFRLTGAIPAPVATVLATTNGGRSWAREDLVPGIGELLSISCPNTSDCWALGYTLTGLPTAGSFVVATTNGGRTWKVQMTLRRLLPQLLGISCTNTSDCWAVGSLQALQGLILATHDGGHSWGSQSVRNGRIGPLRSISCLAGTDACWAVGWDGQTNFGGEVLSTR